MRKPLSLIFILFAVGLVIYWQAFSAVSLGTGKSVIFVIEKGDNVKDIAQKLEDQNFIRSGFVFTTSAKIGGLEKKLQHGRYQLRTNMNAQQILNAIANPTLGEIAITIPEGFSVQEIDERLTGEKLIESGEFRTLATGLEGYLFPDTYFVFGTNFNPEDLIERMRSNFLEKITPDLNTAIEKSGRTLSEIITMASIVEKEVRTEEDYAIVSGILWKRLDNDWALQTDATLLYGKSAPQITAKELDEDSPYNTRKFRGLPPTPIDNPGLATIRAAIFPKPSNYWFYLTDKEGGVHYATTNEAHNENRRKYLD